MSRLSQADAAEFRAVRDVCHEGLDSLALLQRLGDRLGRYLGLSSYCLGASDPSTALPVQSITVGLDAAAMDDFFRLVLTTPTLDFGSWVKHRRRVRRLDELVDDVDRDPYMTDILRPNGLRYEVQVACTSGGWSWGHLCLRKQEKDGDFKGQELRFLDALVPHLTAGLKAAATRAAVSASPGATTGVIVLGPGGEVELTNGIAERLFSRPSGGSRQSFVTAVNIVVSRLRFALNEEAEPSVPVLTLTDEEFGEVYRLRAERIRGADGLARGLIVIEPATGPHGGEAIERLIQLGLTPREAEVALAVLRGESIREIAGKLIISPHTVHDHLGNLYDKLGIGSRQELVMRLMGGT